MTGAWSSAPRTPRPRDRWRPRIDQYKRTWYLLRRNPLGIVGLAIIVLLVFVALYAATLPLPWNQMNAYCPTWITSPGCTHVCTYYGSTPPGPNCYKVAGPDWVYFVPPTVTLSSPGPLPMGSMSFSGNNSGYFYSTYQGILRGSDWSLMIAVSIVGAAAAIGLVVGALSGFFGGAVDESLMRLVDVFLSIPSLLFIIVTISVFTTFSIPGLTPLTSRVALLILAFTVVLWPIYAREVRGQVLVTREQKYVEAARASGAGRARVLARHIVPNSMYPIFIQMSLDVGATPLVVGALGFLGFNLFGLPTGQVFPEWGSLSAFSVAGFSAVFTACESGICVVPWWQILFPGLMLFLLAIGVNFFADGLRDALDPRLRR